MALRTIGLTSKLFGTAMLLATALAAERAAHAESVYRCRDAAGHVAFQDRPCAARKTESLVEIRPAPPPAPSPDYGIAAAPRRVASSRAGHGAKTREVVSFECRAANGEVFYRHGACPKTVTAAARDASSSSKKRGKGGATQSYTVSANALPRGEVCRRLAAAGSIGRAGHGRDEVVSSYEKNLGRDPCRRF